MANSIENSYKTKITHFSQRVAFFDLSQNCRDAKWEIKKDTLYFAEKPVAKIISLVHRGFMKAGEGDHDWYWE